MIRRIIVVRYLALALLATAQLSVAVHANEHGHGEHDHDGAPCLVAAVNDNDTDALPLPPLTVLAVSGDKAERAAHLDLSHSTSDLRIPPATGPPACS